MVLTLCIAFACWAIRYDRYDPRSIQYVFWKHGLNRNMDLDAAVFAMGRDPDRERLVQGLTQGQLQARFGDVRPLERVSPYL